jgi:Na+-translocating ferredoxin:NAD+ oxidoreductase RnfD subunit
MVFVMPLNFALAPHVRKKESSRSVMMDAIIPLLMLLIVPFIYSSLRVLSITGAAVLSAVVSEALFCLFARKDITVADLSAVVTGLVVAMLMPVSAPLWLPVAASAFAILVVKMPLGGMGNTPFNPAAGGVAFATVFFTGELFKYRDTKLLEPLPVFANPNLAGVESPALLLHRHTRPDIFPSEMALGNFPGPMGTSAVLVIAACAIYLMLRKTVPWQIPVFFIGTAAVFALLFPRIPGNRLESLTFELLSGSLVFAGVFMAAEPSTAPKSSVARGMYGALGGLLCMLLRYFGIYEQGACFAILMVNAVSYSLDRLGMQLAARGKR